MTVKLSGSIVFLVVSVQTCFGILPSTIVPCRRNDPDLNNCIIKAIENVKPLLALGDFGDGYRSPSLEPLYMDIIELEQSDKFQAVFTDMEVSGGSNFMINKLIANASNLAFDVIITLPRIEIAGKYLIKLNILLMDLEARGNLKGYTENALALIKIRGIRVPEDGVEYVKFTNMTLKIHVKFFKMYFDCLFNEDPILRKIGNSVISDNRLLYFNEILPALENGLSKNFLNIANMMMSNITYDEMFPI